MRFFRLLFLIFLSIPILEIYLLITVGIQFGPYVTVGLVVGTAILGAALIRSQGIQTMAKIKASTSRGEIPAIPMVEGLLLLIAGALLLTPGFFTDALGFLVIIPILRQQIAKNIIRAGMFHAMGQAGGQAGGSTSSSSANPSGSRHQATLEGEFKVDDD